MLTTLKSGDFPSGRLMFQPDAENVPGGVDIAIMRYPAVRAFPTPHSKRTHAFRAAGGYRPTSRARLGTVSLVGFNKHGSVPSGLVAEHVPELRPASVKHGFGHPCLGEASGVHIADDDEAVFADNLGGLLMKVVTAHIRDLCVDGSCTFLVSGSLGCRQFGLIFAVVAKVGNGATVTQGGKCGKPQVDAYRPAAGRKIVGNIALEYRIPAASRVLHKLTEAKFALHFSAFPKAVMAFEIDGAVSIDLCGSWNKRNPAKRPLRPETGSKGGATPMLITRSSELPAYLANGIRMQPQISGSSGCKPDQLKGSWPSAVATTPASAFGLALGVDAEVPDLIASDCMAAQMPVATLDTILEADNAQRGPRSVASDQVKSASSDCRPVARSPFVSYSLSPYKGYRLSPTGATHER